MRLATLGLLGILTSACASTGAVPQPFPAPGHPALRPAGPPAPSPTSAEAPAEGEAGRIVSTALGLRGAPYRNGGSDPGGFDCSGFVWYVFAQNGVAVPRTVADQFRAGQSIKERDLRPGDLVFFETGSTPASHVGVVVGGDAFVHAPSARGEVRVEHLSARYWSSRFAGARRLR